MHFLLQQAGHTPLLIGTGDDEAGAYTVPIFSEPTDNPWGVTYISGSVGNAWFSNDGTLPPEDPPPPSQESSPEPAAAGSGSGGGKVKPGCGGSAGAFAWGLVALLALIPRRR
jgi:uncharacterized protein (TIGR03382 family)